MGEVYVKKWHYGIMHYFQSAESEFRFTASNQLVGDALCLAGALLYGVSNVAQEAVVKNFNRVEFLGMIGLFGSMVNGVQL